MLQLVQNDSFLDRWKNQLFNLKALCKPLNGTEIVLRSIYIVLRIKINNYSELFLLLRLLLFFYSNAPTQGFFTILGSTHPHEDLCQSCTLIALLLRTLCTYYLHTFSMCLAAYILPSSRILDDPSGI